MSWNLAPGHSLTCTSTLLPTLHSFCIGKFHQVLVVLVVPHQHNSISTYKGQEGRKWVKGGEIRGSAGSSKIGTAATRYDP